MSNYCITARRHDGDENGSSQVRFRTPTLSGEARAEGYDKVYLDTARTVSFSKESSSHLVCGYDPAEVIVRRTHSGDENGATTYEVAKVIIEKKLASGEVVKVNGISVFHPDYSPDNVICKDCKESKSGWVENGGFPIVARKHSGDENGRTQTWFSEIYIYDNGVTPYKLIFSNEQTSGSQKESKSDFYIKEEQII